MTSATDKFELANRPEKILDEVYEGQAKWKETLSIFCKNKGAVIGMVFLII